MKGEPKVKSFYIEHDYTMSNAQVYSLLSKAVATGAEWGDYIEGKTRSSFDVYDPSQFYYFGINDNGLTKFYDQPRSFGDNAVRITPDQVDEHLGLTKVDESSDDTPKSLVGCKIDLRNEDGGVNSELSAAFQEACFAQGLKWKAHGSVITYSDKPFLYVGNSYITYNNHISGFSEDGNKEVKFEFERKLNWSVKYMTNETTRKIVEIGGVIYYEDKLLEAVQLLEAAKVVDSGVVTPTAGGGTPPDRDNNQ